MLLQTTSKSLQTRSSHYEFSQCPQKKYLNTKTARTRTTNMSDIWTRSNSTLKDPFEARRAVAEMERPDESSNFSAVHLTKNSLGFQDH